MKKVNKQFRKGLTYIAQFRIDRCGKKKRIQNFLTPKEIKAISYSIAKQSEMFIIKNLDKMFYNKHGDNNVVLKGLEYEPSQNRTTKPFKWGDTEYLTNGDIMKAIDTIQTREEGLSFMEAYSNYTKNSIDNVKFYLYMGFVEERAEDLKVLMGVK